MQSGERRLRIRFHSLRSHGTVWKGIPNKREKLEQSYGDEIFPVYGKELGAPEAWELSWGFSFVAHFRRC